MEEARTIEHRKDRAERMAARLAGGEDPEDAAMKDAQEQAALISERLLALRDALEDLEDELHTVEGGQPARRTRTRSTS